MNGNSIDMERMRKAWIEMGQALGMDMPQNYPSNMNNRNTALDRLRRRYLNGWKFSFTVGILLAVSIYFIPSLGDQYRISLIVAYLIIILSNGCVWHWLWKGLEKINPIKMPITQVCSMAKYYKKRHLLYNLVVCPIAILWSGCFLSALNDSLFSGMRGMIMGIILGCGFAFYGLWAYMRDYRDVTN